MTSHPQSASMSVKDGETRLARDQYGDPWIVFGRVGSIWANGLDEDQMPISRYICEQTKPDLTLHTDLSKPNGIRYLNLLAEAAASPSPSVDREVNKFLRAVADGFTGKIEHGYLCVENPDATPQSLALGGDDPNLVVSADAILALLHAPTATTAQNESMAALQARADGNAQSCAEFCRYLRLITQTATAEEARSLANKALRMPWLSATPAQAARESEWRDIASAPKDGSYILVAGTHSRALGYPVRQLVVRWDSRSWESADDGYGVYLTPTHWMPLPPAPPVSVTSDGGES